MRRRIIGLFLATALLAAGLSSGCATTRTTSTTWTEAGPPPQWARYGRVQWIREVIVEHQGNPGGGAVAGAIIGGILGGGHGPGALFGAATGAAVGAAASSGGSVSRRYEMLVAFSDGGSQVFVYGDYPPFRPGEGIVETQYGLQRY